MVKATTKKALQQQSWD